MERIIIKKISLTVAGIAVVGILGLGQSAYADETSASVNVNSGGIKISQATDITFNDVTISKEAATVTEKEKSSISIEDLRGESSKGWRLTAKLKDENFKGMALNISPEVISNTAVEKAGITANLNSHEQPIAYVADTDIKYTNFT
ncbi:hypothetical protein [Candidatus Enterococcus ikei]|uniref:WxL domain-containing protein n=1 Tax=Candidatus Enterococcus ikei TaxID=2815326 RepID=A0ABS3H191_9ENTE|nr:hypothetical protein [Enterococcus sp. DIV0869a]MBO0441286.1 hypothetical protein [Enterococcus sp. DIV0869a]